MISRKSMAFVFVAASVLSAHSAHAKQIMCVFDVQGASGEIFALMRDYAVAAKRWGADIQLRAYPNERVATEDFKAGQCDAAFLTGIRGRQFNSFTGSMDAFGAIPSNVAAAAAIRLVSRPKLAGDMVQGNYEIAGILSLGSAYMMLHDRTLDTLTKLSGKKIAVLEHDPTQFTIAQSYGLQPVQADVHTFGGLFNNGQVDMIGAPAMLYRPMELYRGIGTNGGVMRFPMLHVTTNIIIDHSKFPVGFGQKSRDWAVAQLPRVFRLIERLESDIPKETWIELSANDYVGYMRLVRETRVSMTRKGLYHPKMMRLLKRLRCVQNPNSFECSLKDE